MQNPNYEDTIVTKRTLEGRLIQLMVFGLGGWRVTNMVFLSLNFSHCRFTLWLLLYSVDLVKLLFSFFLFFSFRFHATINGG